MGVLGAPPVADAPGLRPESRATLLALAALFVPTQLAMLWMDQQLDPGIIPFELAWTAERSAEILAGWGPSGRALAMLAHIVDYGYLVAYGGGAAWFLRRLGAVRSAWLPLVAAGCDAVENAALIAILATGPTTTLTVAAASFAAVKFALLAVGAVAGIWLAVGRLR